LNALSLNLLVDFKGIQPKKKGENGWNFHQEGFIAVRKKDDKTKTHSPFSFNISMKKHQREKVSFIGGGGVWGVTLRERGGRGGSSQLSLP